MVTKKSNKEKEKLKRMISDLYYERTQFWRTSDQHEETDNEINKIAKILKKKYKLESWEF